MFDKCFRNITVNLKFLIISLANQVRSYFKISLIPLNVRANICLTTNIESSLKTVFFFSLHFLSAEKGKLWKKKCQCLAKTPLIGDYHSNKQNFNIYISLWWKILFTFYSFTEFIAHCFIGKKFFWNFLIDKRLYDITFLTDEATFTCCF